MNTVLKLESLEKLTIDITFNLTYICNFSCRYCVAWERNEKIFIFNESSRYEIENFIESLQRLNKNIKINFLLSWGEPLIHTSFIEIITFLLSFEGIMVQVITNWFLMKTLEKRASILRNSRFSFFYTYHFDEYRKLDPEWKIVLQNIRILKENDISFKLNFLIPSKMEDFETFKQMRDFIVDKCELHRDEYEYNLIQENGTVSEVYNQSIIDYYHQIKTDELDEDHKNIAITLKDGTEVAIRYTREIIERWYNQFHGYSCYPYSIPTNIQINPDLSVVFAGCSTLNKTTYTLDEAIWMMKKPEKSVICNDLHCTCTSNIGIKKEYNTSLDTKLKKVHELIEKKILSFITIDSLDSPEFRLLLNDAKWIIFTYKNNSWTLLNISVELRNNSTTKYARIIDNLWIHFYKTNYQWGIVNKQTDELDSVIPSLLWRIWAISRTLEQIIRIL